MPAGRRGVRSGGGGGSGVTDHGALTGLADDDHAAYATDTDLATHEADTTSVHGITDTSVLATATSVATAVSNHEADTTSVHGITDTSALALTANTVTPTGGGKETFQAHGAMGATETFDLANGNLHTGTLDAACTFTFTGTTASKVCAMTLILTQDATGSRLVTWPASVDWPAGTAPVLSTGVNKVDVLSFVTVDNGTTWLGFLSGLDLR